MHFPGSTVNACRNPYWRILMNLRELLERNSKGAFFTRFHMVILLLCIAISGFFIAALALDAFTS